MASPAKFLFAREFAAPDARPADIERRIARLEADLAAAEYEREALRQAIALAREEAQAEGYRRGCADRQGVELARVAAAAEAVAHAAQALTAGLERERLDLEREAVALAVAVASRLARGLVAREPVAEIERLAREALAHVRGAPHLVVRVAPDLVEAVERAVARAAHARGFGGKLVVLGDPDMPGGDARIDWADGGLVRDQGAVMAAVTDAVARYLAARQAGEAA